MHNTLRSPLGGELYLEIKDRNGGKVALTYNDLWALIVCRTSMDGDWTRMREATNMIEDAGAKREIVERLWKLEQSLDGLPPIPDDLVKLNLQRAHQWFNKRPVSFSRNW
jgi:hypothetical protein